MPIEFILKDENVRNYLATIAIGEPYYSDWLKFASPAWIEYCERNMLGLFVIKDDLVPKEDPFWKKATWQKMLIGDAILNQTDVQIDNVCYLDTDILINPYAPNVFNFHDTEKIGLVSQKINLSFNLEFVLRRISFLRHHFYSKDYPLDSAIFMNLNQIYEYHGLAVQDNYACMGFILFNIKNHSDIMKSWFYKYDKNVKTLTGGGDEPIINYEMLNFGKVNWLEYRFQALWIYEAALHYPFLYDSRYFNEELAIQCIESTLYSNYFLHFAGSWHESNMWKSIAAFSYDKSHSLLNEFYEYLKYPVSGNPVGQIKPKT